MLSRTSMVRGTELKESNARSTIEGRPAAATDRSVRDIILSARSVQSGQKFLVGSAGAWGMSLLSSFLLWACFTPLNASSLAWVALIPLFLLVRIKQATRWMYTAIYFTALVGQLATLQWMRLGDPTMCFAWIALALYLALFSVLFVGVCRVSVQKWGVPLVVAGPLAWVGIEYLRAHLLTGFAWYFLGHSQYRWLELIQICDLVGAYGVSFVIAMSSASLALLIPHAWLIRFRLAHSMTEPIVVASWTWPQLVQVLASGVVFGSTLMYGYVRRSQAAFTPGPRVALIQGNFPASLRVRPPSEEDVFLKHLQLMAQTVKEQPDLIVWPEGMFPYPLLQASLSCTDEQLQNLTPYIKPEQWRSDVVRQTLMTESLRTNAALIVGINSFVAEPNRLYQYNSAAFIQPGMGLTERYDKLHRVPFGEYIPLRDWLPWLAKLMPYRGSEGLDQGRKGVVFQYGKWRMAPVICFEDTVPHLVRSLVAVESDNAAEKRVDLLVNLSNDGWFHGSSELEQHLITAAFRAVECRLPLVRAVNTGISAIIDGDGAILNPEVFIDGDARKNAPAAPRTSARDLATGAWHKQLNAAIVHTVPLDSRRSLYVRWGDWFAMICGTFLVCVSLSVAIPKAGSRRSSPSDR